MNHIFNRILIFTIKTRKHFNNVEHFNLNKFIKKLKENLKNLNLQKLYLQECNLNLSLIGKIINLKQVVEI